MKKICELILEDDNVIRLPENVKRNMLLRKGDKICLFFETSLKDKCFKISCENDEELFDEDFYCVPKRIFDNCNISFDDIHIIQNKGSMTLTSSEVIIRSLGKEVIACLIEQDVDLQLLAEDLVDCMNDEIGEDNEEYKENL